MSLPLIGIAHEGEVLELVTRIERCRALSGRAFQCANSLGRCSVILPSGHRAVVEDHTVITVLPLNKPRKRK